MSSISHSMTATRRASVDAPPGPIPGYMLIADRGNNQVKGVSSNGHGTQSEGPVVVGGDQVHAGFRPARPIPIARPTPVFTSEARST